MTEHIVHIDDIEELIIAKYFIEKELLESKEIKTENNKYLDNMYKDYKEFCNSMDIDEIDLDDAIDAIDEIVQAVRR